MQVYFYIVGEMVGFAGVIIDRIKAEEAELLAYKSSRV